MGQQGHRVQPLSKTGAPTNGSITEEREQWDGPEAGGTRGAREDHADLAQSGSTPSGGSNGGQARDTGAAGGGTQAGPSVAHPSPAGVSPSPGSSTEHPASLWASGQCPEATQAADADTVQAGDGLLSTMDKNEIPQFPSLEALATMKALHEGEHLMDRRVSMWREREGRPPLRLRFRTVGSLFPGDPH